MTKTRHKPKMGTAANEQSSLLPPLQKKPQVGQLTNLFEPTKQTRRLSSDLEYLIPIDNEDDKEETVQEAPAPKCSPRIDVTSTIIGSLTFLLYHVVFCLAQAATITRPHATHVSTGIMAKTAAIGIIMAGPMFLFGLSSHIPAIYPTSDLFLAPFLAHLAEQIDEVLYQHGLENDDRIFLATFGAVSGAGFLLSGVLCILAARVKLANLGVFLPYSVLCGFFTTIGILMWTLGFNVDTGNKVGQVVFSKDWSVIQSALLHHTPSLVVGIVMHIVGPKNPFLVMVLVGTTIAGSYVIMALTGTTLQQAQEWNWFFSAKDLVSHQSPDATTAYGPPLPFGVLASIAQGKVFWEAFLASISTVLALAFLYLIRCSLHSAALKKNIPNVTRKQPEPPSPSSTRQTSVTSSIRQQQEGPSKRKGILTLGYILEHGYGYSQLVAAFTGGVPVAPSVAASLTLFKLGAEAAPPQYGSCLLVLVFYLTDFRLVQYIPKPAFSCLMVLAGLDMCRVWLVGSFSKTKAKSEWMIAPVLVVLAFSVGMLNAIFLGVALSTFIFVANFYRAGSVKFVGNGLTLRSPVERGLNEAAWLNQNADLIQILILQNYLFFGNAQSVFTYISTMFEDEPAKEDSTTNIPIPPIPKYLIVDFTLVSGLDTSAIDLFREIVDLCKENKCRLFLAGLSISLKSKLLYAGIKPESGSKRFSYASDLESALAKAEDGLITNVFHLEEKDEKEYKVRRRHRSESNAEDGFVYALQKIDEQHGLNTVKDIEAFRQYTEPIELEPGEILYRDVDGDHGLYFVETGLMRVRHSSGLTTMNMNPSGTLPGAPSTDFANPTASIGHLNARSGSLGRETAIWKSEQHRRGDQSEHSFRLARIGQGWIIGTTEAAGGMKRAGVHVAMSNCRLHHLPYSAIKEVETINPTMAMHLYKLLAHLSTKRQEATIEQLGQFARILKSPVPRLRGGKTGLAKLHMQGL